DRHLGIDARQAHHVDAIGAEVVQHRVAGLAHVGRAAVVADAAALVVEQPAELHAEDDLVAPPFDGAADELQVVPGDGIAHRAVEQRHAEIDRATNRGLAFGLRAGAVGPRHGKTAEPELGNRGAVATERGALHGDVTNVANLSGTTVVSILRLSYISPLRRNVVFVRLKQKGSAGQARRRRSQARAGRSSDSPAGSGTCPPPPPVPGAGATPGSVSPAMKSVKKPSLGSLAVRSNAKRRFRNPSELRSPPRMSPKSSEISV